jgi:hypothetical protein
MEIWKRPWMAAFREVTPARMNPIPLRVLFFIDPLSSHFPIRSMGGILVFRPPLFPGIESIPSSITLLPPFIFFLFPLSSPAVFPGDLSLPAIFSRQKKLRARKRLKRLKKISWFFPESSKPIVSCLKNNENKFPLDTRIPLCRLIFETRH